MRKPRFSKAQILEVRVLLFRGGFKINELARLYNCGNKTMDNLINKIIETRHKRMKQRNRMRKIRTELIFRDWTEDPNPINIKD